jgi:MoaA/NifB/PqqE/SkfB family radical SAM enzyme
MAARDSSPFVALEITERCQLRCTHCYAGSGPEGTHGRMGTADWMRVIDDAAQLGAPLVQLIGGEPTLHPDLGALVEHALDRRMAVEVYSNLVSIPARLWPVLEQPGVRLATSYYAPTSTDHDAVTARRGSHDRTLRNVREARRRGIPVRVGIIQVSEVQDVAGAAVEMRQLGVERVSVDRMREVGRGVRTGQPGVEQLCGRCADGRLAVSPDGDVWPCVFSRWLVIGNVLDRSLGDVDSGAAAVRSELGVAFSRRPPLVYADGDSGCTPAPCTPIIDGK